TSLVSDDAGLRPDHTASPLKSPMQLAQGRKGPPLPPPPRPTPSKEMTQEAIVNLFDDNFMSSAAPTNATSEDTGSLLDLDFDHFTATDSTTVAMAPSMNQTLLDLSWEVSWQLQPSPPQFWTTGVAPPPPRVPDNSTIYTPCAIDTKLFLDATIVYPLKQQPVEKSATEVHAPEVPAQSPPAASLTGAVQSSDVPPGILYKNPPPPLLTTPASLDVVMSPPLSSPPSNIVTLSAPPLQPNQPLLFTSPGWHDVKPTPTHLATQPNLCYFFHVQAQHNYTALDSDELGLQHGDVISVWRYHISQSTDDSGWLLGIKEADWITHRDLDEHKGVFPENFTVRID
uniref:SH3 domain-containing protein n=1 Tax=Petromyzon marinus TaxID=7757 RepID=S4RTZ8_PETMA